MRYIVRRLLLLIPVLLIVSFFAFYLINLLPGDPTVTILGPNATAHARAQLRAQLGLNQPLLQRYFTWLWHALQGDLGKSYINGQSVSQAISEHLPTTLELLVGANIIAVLLAVPLGVISATRPNGRFDQSSTGATFALLALPPFILGVLLVYLFAVHWKIFPATGYIGLSQDPLQNLRDMVLPCITLGLGTTAVYMRVLRADMIATLQEDYITMAKAKGLSTARILARHAFRPSTFTLVTVGGLTVGALIGGAFIIEILFALPGIGSLTLNAIYGRDYLVVQGCVLVVTVGFVLVNFIVDLLYPFLDPRTRSVRVNV
jgi:peptide/nickel transport system permease protein